ncbi:MAG: hypothetical protein EBZ47_09080, partial [Chlamydiae bacterium]|nr:hypothetical protein [Chlamydiota bacterium]
TIAPQVYFKQEKTQNQVVSALIQEGVIQACHDISSGGLLVALYEMLGYVGAHIEAPEDILPFLFSENGGYIVATENPERFEKISEVISIGRTSKELLLVISQNGHPIYQSFLPV